MQAMGSNSLYGPLDPAPDAGYVDAPPRMGFFTDTSVCIGCKACEVARKEWNLVPDDGFTLLGQSYDNTGGLTANSWRHVAFIEQPRADGGGGTDVLGAFAGTPAGPSASGRSAATAATTVPETGTEPGLPPGGGPQFLGMPQSDLPGRDGELPRSDFRWLMMSNVCKHCTHAGRPALCPTRAPSPPPSAPA